MTAWVTITDPNTATGAIITQTLMRAYRDNMRSLAEDDATVPALDTIKRLGRQNRIVVGTIADDTVHQLQVGGKIIAKGGTSGMVTGEWTGISGGFAYWQNSALALAAGNYALIQEDLGNTCLNAAATRTLSLRIANIDRLVIAAGGDVTVAQNMIAASFGTTGTFTPSLAGLTTPGTQTYANRSGRYRKIGKQVFFTIYMTLTAKDAATAGDLYISGLPFTSANVVDRWHVGIPRANNFTLGAALSIWGDIGPADTRIFLFKSSAAGEAAMLPADFTATIYLYLSGWYDTP